MIKISNLSIQKEGKFILKDINFCIKEGKITIILGQSGIGKSLIAGFLLNSLAKNLKYYGEIYLENENLKELIKSKKISQNQIFSAILQNPQSAFHPFLKIENFLKDIFKASSFKNLKNINEVIKNALKKSGFKDESVLKLYPHQLSGGMAQKVMIASALILNSKFIIADEATANLDKNSENEILQNLKQIAKENNTGIVLITHDIEIVKNMADYICVIEKNGADFGEKNEILSKNIYAKKLLNSWEKLNG